MKRILLVGLGGMGKVHFANYSHLKTQCTVIAAVGKGKADEKFARDNGLPFFPSIESAVEEVDGIDVVDITTPSFLHRENVEEALRCGKDVICEKPLALDPADALSMIESARSRGLRLEVAMVCRYTKEFGILKDLLASGKYGRLEEVSFVRLSQTPQWSAGGWLTDRSKSGLVPFDLMIHDIDMMIALLGAGIKEKSFVKSGHNHYHMACQYKDGPLALIESGWIDACIPFQATWKATFEHAVVENDGVNVSVYSDEGKTDLTPSYPVVVSTGINVPPTGWYYEELKAILDKLEKDEKSDDNGQSIVSALEIARWLSE